MSQSSADHPTQGAQKANIQDPVGVWALARLICTWLLRVQDISATDELETKNPLAGDLFLYRFKAVFGSFWCSFQVLWE